MIVEYIRYPIEPARADELVEAYGRAATSLKESAHCLGFELSQCTEASGSFVLRITWDSEEGHLKGFRASPQFRPFFVAIEPYVKNIEEMRHYQLTTVRWAR